MNKQVCIHNNWWTEIIWNKDEECYYTNGLLKRLHDHDETDSKSSKEEPDNAQTKGPTVDQQIRQTPIDPALHTSPLITISNSLPEESTTMSTQTITAMMATTTLAFGTIPTPQQKIATAMQKALQGKGKGSRPPGGGGSSDMVDHWDTLAY